MSGEVSEHDHCRYCGDAVPFDQAYCCEDCYYKDQARIRKEKRNETLIAVTAALGVAVILILGYIF